MSLSGNSPETIRYRCLKHETHLKQLGRLNQFLGLFFALGAVIALFTPMGKDFSSVGLALILSVPAAAYLIWGGMLARLDSRIRLPLTLLALVELLGFPLGTIKGLFLLYLLHSPEGKYLFTPEYKSVMAATPQIKYRTSKVLLVVLGILVVVMIFIGVMVMLHP